MKIDIKRRFAEKKLEKGQKELNPSYIKLKQEDSENYIDVVNSNSETDVDVTFESGEEINDYPQSIDRTSIPDEGTCKSESKKDFKEECIRKLKDDVML